MRLEKGKRRRNKEDFGHILPRIKTVALGTNRKNNKGWNTSRNETNINMNLLLSNREKYIGKGNNVGSPRSTAL